MNTRFFIYFILSGIIFSVFNSCKKDTAAEKEVPKVSEACQLISLSEAQEITGYTYTETESSENTVIGSKLCDYSNADFVLFQVGVTQTAAINGAGLKRAVDYYESMKTTYPDYHLVSNVGDEAFIYNKFIFIKYTNDYYINICITYNGLVLVSKREADLVKAGQKAIENLKKLL